MSIEPFLAALEQSNLPLQGKLDALRTEFETKLAPAAIVDALHRSIDELIAGGAAGLALKTGDAAPSFVLPDVDALAVSSKDLLARGPVVLTFYRGVWCPYCNLDLQALESARPGIEARGATLVAISP